MLQSTVMDVGAVVEKVLRPNGAFQKAVVVDD